MMTSVSDYKSLYSMRSDCKSDRTNASTLVPAPVLADLQSASNEYKHLQCEEKQILYVCFNS